MRTHAIALLAIAVHLLPAALGAQEYAWEDLQNQQVRFQRSTKLAQVPMRIGDMTPNQVAKFEPDNEGDYIWGRYGKFKWTLEVYEFAGTSVQPEEPDTGGSDPKKPKTREEAEQEARAAMMAKNTARTFADWVKDPRNATSSRRFLIEGKEKKATSKNLGFTWWEYSDPHSMVNGYGETFDQMWHSTAVAYTLPDGREVALVVSLPVKKDTPESKWRNIVRRMLTSLNYVEAEIGDEADENRDEFAETEKQKEQLQILKDNIRNLDNWDYFTTPDFIITYGWGKPEQRRDMHKFAKWVGEKLEDARTMFKDRYPPHEKMEYNYSIIRVCHDYDEFRKYGDTRYGVVGWFSPSSKELVIYYDKRHELVQNEEEMLGIAYHEAWHQYSDQYWASIDLHRWFDEGMAEYFGSYRMKGKREVFVGQKGRVGEMTPLISSGGYVPSAEIVAWDKPTFYGGNASAHYAQAWVMVDFLIRGERKLGRRWNPRWSTILSTYATTALEKRSEKKAIEAAFEGVDMAEYEAAWIEWFKSGNVKRG